MYYINTLSAVHAASKAPVHACGHVLSRLWSAKPQGQLPHNKMLQHNLQKADNMAEQIGLQV